MNEETARRGLSPRIMVLLVVGVFVVPIGVAYWMVLAPPDGGARINRGTLITPPVDIKADDSYTSLRQVQLEPGEWALVLVNAGDCDAECAASVNMLQSIDTVLGQATTRVRVALLTDAGESSASGVTTVADARARGAVSQSLLASGAGTAGGVVFLDWRGQIMMHYPDTSAPGDIKHDLKRLLRASKIR